ncbi:MAG: pentapeptide repeat-containing protein [Bauldia sp.]|nr:pentapeptide repeat-containing protein [Bauldia sp.]
MLKITLSVCALGAVLIAGPAAAQAPALEAAGLYAPSAFDLALGAHASELPTDQFIRYACGTNGGPPSRPLAGWTGFAECRPDPSTGFHEVYFLYDNELEYVSKARGLVTQAALYQYTSAYEIPVVASALFDDDGFYVGLRLITDPRVPVALREKGSALGNFLIARYGEGWACEELPRLPGEQPYLGSLIKRACMLSAPNENAVLSLEIHQFRKAGQGAIDLGNNLPTEGQFESSTRFEMMLDGPVENGAARAAEIAARPPAGPSERELLAARALNCPGCDLQDADLKRANLSGAQLAGANLTGANLHEADLSNADLTGAILDGANINHAILRRANLEGASLKNVMLYETRLDGANLTGAAMNGALAGMAHFPGAQLVDVVMIDGDLRAARINDANLSRADLRGTWFDDAQMMRADFSEARLAQTIMWGVNLTGAKLAGADMRASDLIRANLRGADLSGADLTEARLTFANLADTTLTGAVFEDAQLPGGFSRPQ